ncbi:MAG: hypothetical protein JJU11_16310 [Candidatus Sumerlaeia bacterium]|nr:hypothetical protein [Candidatus Sumerlaeia bacterium]
MTPEQIQQIIERVNSRLITLGRGRGVDLHVEKEGSTFDDDWLYVSVETTTDKIRVADFAEILSEIEAELRQQGVNNVLLVPSHAGGGV